MNKLLKYNQAKYAVFDIIAKQHLNVGERLPSLRKMTEDFPFSEICLRRALNELADEGYLEKRRCSGIYLAKSIDLWERKDEMLFLEVAPFETTIPGSVIQLKNYLRERNVTLRTMTATIPDEEILRATDGCLGALVSGWVTPEWVKFLRTMQVPVLYIGSYGCTQGLPTVDYDWKAAARLLIDTFMERGFRRIGLINGSRDYFPAHQMAEVYLEEVRKHKLDADDSDILWKPTWNARSVREFLSSRRPYDALVIEPGALIHVLICSHQFNLSRESVLGVIGGNCDNNFTTDRMVYIAFSGQIYVEAGKVFFESLNDPDYFKSGPRLLAPRIVKMSSN